MAVEAPAAEISMKQGDPQHQEEVGSDRLPAGPLGWWANLGEGLGLITWGGSWQRPSPTRATTKGPLFLSERLFLARLGHSTLSSLLAAQSADTKASVSLLSQPGPRRPCAPGA